MRLVPCKARRPRAPRSILAAVALATATTALPQPPVSAQEATIMPGVALVNESGGQCTTNWVYDGSGAQDGEVFIGTAAHCVEQVGEQIAMQTGTFGESVLTIGEVAFISSNLDYALIRIDDAHVAEVSPGMKGHPEIPTGMSTTESAAVGDIVQFSGNGVGFHATTSTQEERVGILHYNDGIEWSAAGTVSPGDSGGPIADATDDNKALGIVTVICVGLPCSGAGGVSLEGLINDAASSGVSITLRTV